MLYSKLFTKTSKNFSKDEITKNAQLLTRAGYINKLMAGVYSFLPLGLKVLRRIEAIIREEMEEIGGQEVLLPALHPAENWRKTNGWDTIDILFKIKSRTQKDYALGQSHEEVITPLVKQYVNSYKDLPLFIYQIQNKYRDELRAKSGLLRGREFGMKDMYSFHLTKNDFERFYAIIKKSYLKIFQTCGLETKVTEASGGAFSQKISYEFMVITQAGEDEIFYCEECDFGVNLAIAKVKKGETCPRCHKGKLKQARAAEVGNVFDLGQKYSQDFDFYVIDKAGKKVYPYMGCYGIGTTRLLAVLIEKYHDEKGICWPMTVAPFEVELINLGGEEIIKQKASQVYNELCRLKFTVLWDDRETSSGQKLSEADLIGVPVRLVVSGKTAEKIEWKMRTDKKVELLTLQEVVKRLRT